MFQILVADDDKNTRRLLETILSNAGYKTISVASAGRALELIQKVPIDLLIVDIMMPGMDGYEFTKLLRDCRYDLDALRKTASG